MKAYEHDVAVSAVAYDALLVADIVARLKPALSMPIVWAGHDEAATASSGSSVLVADARVVLVLLHPLWSHEPSTAADSGLLRQRMRKDPKSVIVLTVDGTVVPDWLAKAKCHDLGAEGLEPVIDGILACVAKQGGAVVEIPTAPVADAPHRPRFAGEAPPFLEQSRAQNALRRELEKMSEAIEERLDTETARNADETIELSSFPNRVIARQGGVAISFSWLAGRLGGISDGRLLVIGWADLSPTRRGTAALSSATHVRETSYRAEAADAATWCWRASDVNGRACSTSDLVSEWFDVAALRPVAADAAVVALR